MPRPRAEQKSSLPPNLYESKGYFQYKDPKSGKFIGLGRDKNKAIEFVMNNMRFVIPDEDEPLKNGDRLFPSVKEIVAMSKRCTQSSGIYFLISEGKIIYVGTIKRLLSTSL